MEGQAAADFQVPVPFADFEDADCRPHDDEVDACRSPAGIGDPNRNWAIRETQDGTVGIDRGDIRRRACPGQHREVGVRGTGRKAEGLGISRGKGIDLSGQDKGLGTHRSAEIAAHDEDRNGKGRNPTHHDALPPKSTMEQSSTCTVKSERAELFGALIPLNILPTARIHCELDLVLLNPRTPRSPVPSTRESPSNIPYSVRRFPYRTPGS